MIEREQVRSILVVKLRHIGDVLLSSALFGNLRELFPQARICALVYDGTEEMLQGHPAVDRIYLSSRGLRQASLWKRLQCEASLLMQLRRERFDVVINLTEGDRGAIAALVSGAAWRVGVDSLGQGLIGKNRIYTHIIPRVMTGLHAVEQNLESLKILGFQPVSTRVSFYFSDADAESARTRLSAVGLRPGGFFQAHFTSRWMFKTMPPAKVACLLEQLTERSGLPCLLTSSADPKECRYLDELRRHMKTVPAHFADMRLKELGAVTSMSRFFAGVDSAPMHMAAALEVPVLGVFGPSTARIWGPWDNGNDRNPYTDERGVQCSGKHLVLQSDRDCVPCLRDGCNGSKVSDCLDFDDGVLEAVAARFIDKLNDTSVTEPSGFGKRG